MTPDQTAHVRATFALVQPITDETTALFYERLFELDPTLRPLFARGMADQGRMLMQVIGTAVASLDRLDRLMPTLHDLGRRHAAYGVAHADYGTVADALLWTLEQALGAAFTPAVREAWIAAYSVLAAAMQAGARPQMAAA